jgi:hypothetical protein
MKDSEQKDNREKPTAVGKWDVSRGQKKGREKERRKKETFWESNNVGEEKVAREEGVEEEKRNSLRIGNDRKTAAKGRVQERERGRNGLVEEGRKESRSEKEEKVRQVTNGRSWREGEEEEGEGGEQTR